MKPAELREEIAVELGALEATGRADHERASSTDDRRTLGSLGRERGS